MATIDSLAPETLIRILELVGQQDLPDHRALLATRKTLAAASLVARRWRQPAQAQIWRRLFLRNWGEAKRVFASPLWGEFRTTAVHFRALGNPDGWAVEQLLGEFRGLESLELAGSYERAVDSGWLNLASLSGER